MKEASVVSASAIALLVRRDRLCGWAALAMLLSWTTARAATWDGGGADAYWMTAANWASNTVPVSPEALVFGGTTRLANTNDFAANTQFNGLVFNADAGAFSLGGNTISLGGNIANLSTNAQTITLGLSLLQDTLVDCVGAGVTIGGAISGTVRGLTKNGGAGLTLSGNNGYTGPTTVKFGTLTLSGSLSVDSPLVLGGTETARTMAGFHLNRAGPATQTVNGVQFTAGRSSVTATRASGSGTVVLELGAITCDVGATATFTTNANTAIKTTSPNVNGILGGWAFRGNDWAAVDGSARIGAYTGYTVVSGVPPVLNNNAGSNARIDSTTTGDIAMATPGLTEANTLMVYHAANRNLVIGTDNTLRLGAAGGIWRRSTGSSDGTALVVTNGTLTAGGTDDAAGMIVVRADGDSNSDASGGDGSRAGYGVLIFSVITNNGSGAVTVIKDGNQGARLNGANSYSGGTYVNQGRLQAGHPQALGTGDVFVSSDGSSTPYNGGAVALTGAGNYTNNFSVAGLGSQISGIFGSGTAVYTTPLYLGDQVVVNGNITLRSYCTISAGPGATIAGRILGNYGLRMGGSGAVVTLSNPDNDWSGDFTFVNGGSSGSTSSTLKLGDEDVIPSGSGKGNLILGSVNGNPSVTLDLRGNSQTINGLSSSGGQPANKYIITSGVSGPVALTVGAGDANGLYVGTIQNGSGVLSLTKTGTGTQELGGPCTYTGATIVSNGTLQVAGSLTGTSGVTANTNGIFAYTGATALNRAVMIARGTFRHSSPANYTGTLTFNAGRLSGTNWLGSLSGLTNNTGRIVAPGNIVGTAYTTNQTWSSGGTLEVELSDAAGTAGAGWDLLSLSGALNLVGMTPGGFTVKLLSVNAQGAAAPASNFNMNQTNSWCIASFGSLAGTFDSGAFTVDSSGFANPIRGSFRVVKKGSALYIDYTPRSGTVIQVR